MRRRERADIRRILAAFVGDIDVMGRGETYAVVGGPHEEGYSWTTYWVQTTETSGLYHITVYTNGRDCDGPHSSEQEGTVRLRKRARRVYHERERFPVDVKRRFFPVRIDCRWGKSSQRDYNAERAGY